MTTLNRIKTAVLLGTQRFEVTLDSVVQNLHDGGPIAAVTCGWQERELEDEALRRYLGVEVVNLELRRRSEEVFEEDQELAEAHNHRQQVLRHKQDFYRIRLQFQLEAHRLLRRRSAPEEVHEEEKAASLTAIRTLDDYHLETCAEAHRRFEAATDINRRPSLARHRREIAEILKDCRSLAISGGHVASISNRLSLFGLSEALDGHIVFAWSAGAMAISDRIVLYHDSPPQGPGAAEVMDRGLGWVPGIVVLPEPEKRLRRDDPDRVGVLASRFRPARSLAFPAGTQIVWSRGAIQDTQGVLELDTDGAVQPLRASS